MAAKGSDVDRIVAKSLSFALLGIVSGVWFVAVNNNVKEPYLDEFFHIPQAVKYVQGRFNEWDPKITTPPGLYLASLPWIAVLNRLGLRQAVDIRTKLRGVNQFLGIPGLFHVVPKLLALIQRHELRLPGSDADLEAEYGAGVWETTRNIAFFPPLFFFSALYYTDVLSVLVVLFAYLYFLRGNAVLVLLAGLASLLFRQNNIFWCAVYLAGLEVVRALRRDNVLKMAGGWLEIPEMLRRSWVEGTFYDPVIGMAGLEDYVASVLSLAVAALSNVFRLLPRLLPYIALLGSFGMFVLVNGGVVLGDKSNHVASLHLPQMLYIWAYFAFFSFPVLALSVLGSFATGYRTTRSIPKTVLFLLPHPLLIVGGLVIAAFAVHFNTIIHPFTLADNRHYTFYVFRILRLYPFLRYAAVPVYLICAWACVMALSPPSTVVSAMSRAGIRAQTGMPAPRKALSRSAASGPATGGDGGANRVSFVIVWLISSALGLVTAPLVEPRYFILPWIVWRLHVPPTKIMVVTGLTAQDLQDGGLGGKLYRATSWLAKRALMFETLWALLVNAATMYVFLYWGFEWKQEPGKVQRFMW